jgi:hypothetical protein
VVELSPCRSQGPELRVRAIFFTHVGVGRGHAGEETRLVVSVVPFRRIAVIVILVVVVAGTPDLDGFGAGLVKPLLLVNRCGDPRALRCGDSLGLFVELARGGHLWPQRERDFWLLVLVCRGGRKVL